MEEVFPTVLVAIVGLAIVVTRGRQYDERESRLLLLAYLAHVAAAILQVWITVVYYDGGDMLNYAMYGEQIARVLSYDFGSMAIENVKLTLHMDNAIPVDVFAPGSSSASMCGISGFLLFGLGGSLYASCVFVTTFAYFGNVALYHVFRDTFPDAMKYRLLIATMLVPSVVFWSSGVLKESIAIAGVGWLFLGVHRINQGRFGAAAVLIALGGTTVAILKPYILFPFVLAAAAWVFWERAQRSRGAEAVVVKPIYVVLAAVLAAGGVALLGRLFPEYSVDRLSEETARYQQLGRDVVSDSSFEIGDPSQRSALGQLAFAPVALINSLFRPFFFEVRNVLMLVSALETTALTWLFGRAVWKRSWRVAFDTVRRSPILVFCMVFTLLFGIAVGLVTQNLGTLARYRMPMMPFFVAVVLVVSAPSELLSESDAGEDDREEDDEEEEEPPRRRRALALGARAR